MLMTRAKSIQFLNLISWGSGEVNIICKNIDYDIRYENGENIKQPQQPHVDT